MRLTFQRTGDPSLKIWTNSQISHLANGAHNQLQSSPAMYPLIVEGCLPQISKMSSEQWHEQWHQQHSWVHETHFVRDLELQVATTNHWVKTLDRRILTGARPASFPSKQLNPLWSSRVKLSQAVSSCAKRQFVGSGGYLQELCMCSWTEPIQAADCLLGKAAGFMNEKADKTKAQRLLRLLCPENDCSVFHGFAVCICKYVHMYICIGV